jgi:aerobic-type carbon monoxide dehydrogenase small subunit (CoxS/CutS family)
MDLTVNGHARTLSPPGDESLADTLRDRLHLTGTKVACGRGECGACTVLLDGEPVYSCLTLTRACEGARVETVEGLAVAGVLHPLQEAFIACDATQCGFCTPGQLMAAAALLRRDPAPSRDAIRRAMSGNLCRCGTYPGIVAAIEAVARAGGAPHGT